MSIPGEPSWIEVAVGIAVWASPIVVLIWGAVIASRLIRRKTGYPSSPEGLILMLVVSGISAFLISLPFEIPADYFVIVCLPFAVWVYLAILRRLFGPPAEVREGEQLLRSA
jgi:ABC-type branched-subunit amino acid transport system permease subunit